MIVFDKKGFDKSRLLNLYEAILKPRMIEEKMLLLLRQGKISKWFSGIGQEAISVGSAYAMEKDEYILPMHRNLGIFTTRNIPLNRLFAQFQGKLSGFTKGRDRSFHFGTNDYKLVGMISHLGPQLGVADGIALANKLSKKKKATLVFCGDGGSSEGDFHEAINVAAVWQLPVIFMIENNGYGLSTPSSEQFKFKSFTDKGPGYGIKTESIDGNNVLDVCRCVEKWTKKIRKSPEPVLIEAMTFRMRGHEEASGTKYVPVHLMEYWSKKDPVQNFENYLIKEKILSSSQIQSTRKSIQKEIDEGLKTAYGESIPEADTVVELSDLYKPHTSSEISEGNKKTTMRLVDSISNGLSLAMEKHQNLVLMGQDIADYGGVFKITEGFVTKFGKDRVRNTPLCESAILGVGLGLSIMNMKAMVEMQFADFVSSGFTQLVNNIAKIHYRWGQNADLVIRMPTGAGVGAGPFHSQSNEAWFFNTPGLKIFYPSNPIDAKGLLLEAFEDPNPVLFFEHKALYRSVSAEVDEGYYTIPSGKAAVPKTGSDLTIITYGLGVHWALDEAKKENMPNIEIIDLRTLVPWDRETIQKSIEKTGKALILHEDTMAGGIGGEIASWVAEHCFKYLDGPVMRVSSLDTPVPFSTNLESNFLAKSRLNEKIKDLARF